MAYETNSDYDAGEGNEFCNLCEANPSVRRLTPFVGQHLHHSSDNKTNTFGFSCYSSPLPYSTIDFTYKKFL